ncbi:hypothetical protein BJY52DRAFT_882735 [Lactarius psammicola]|nr:hypothetical protein BJY52DRAFT_882735 [Lactarius psammicola]
MNSIKHGNHGIGQASPKGVTLAPKVTPIAFIEPENDSIESDPEFPTSLFPPVATPVPPSRKRCSPGKRRSRGYSPTLF